MNTGHEGGCGTLHANSAADVPARLEALGLAAGLGRDALHAQAVAAIDVIIHLLREADGHRRVGEVCVLTRSSDGYADVADALRIDRDGAVWRGPAAGDLEAKVARS